VLCLIVGSYSFAADPVFSIICWVCHLKESNVARPCSNALYADSKQWSFRPPRCSGLSIPILIMTQKKSSYPKTQLASKSEVYSYEPGGQHLSVNDFRPGPQQSER
jgi:hypothetical protein